MTDDKKQKLKQRMDALHEKYCKQLPEKYQEIESCWKQYQADLSNPELIETFYRLIHTFKGTAATFSFVQQADVCFEIQKLLSNYKENHQALSEETVSAINELLANFKAIIDAPAKK